MTEKEFTREEMLKYVPEEHVDLHFAKERFKCCPFCGEKPETYVALGGFVVNCINEKCYRVTILHRDLEKLLELWNRRDG